ncbi:hydroxymethylbilane synthase [Wenzhouxiangella marina]|uniref:Porphobilinogen deaminase n=1 Tax=Wenzhouxiangella marina TaxID=1579979 RepID=A0A0K0XXE1_9GAMM|nr:hydroxymethylbilane synthase [Wenzhouxiangella marina]AKS42297.1 porphobilinogen deaminase [Wenzhouxiangella marina]MBB6085930.1 hydroxymethylbilane synthase [Wenzhouxiangella marina]
MNRIRIATRQSRLALWQSEHVAEQLSQAHPDLALELVPLSTRGDEILDRSLAEIGGKGLFLKELEAALLDGRADIAVHSLKDVPAESPPGLVLSVVLPRANWVDWWLNADGLSPEQMPERARVGTSSLRRQSQLLRMHPEFEIVPIRGNVQTRLGKLETGEVDAVILAAAGLERLGLKVPTPLPLRPPEFLPAPGQGVIVVQCREGDAEILEHLACLECAETRARVEAERAVVAALGGDCRMPLAALAEIECDRLRLQARLCSPDGRECLDARVEGSVAAARALGEEAAELLKGAGAMRILSRL